MSRRVVITGMGAVTPLGVNVGSFWDGLISGRSGIGEVTHFDTSPFDVRFGGYCDQFDPKALFDVRAIKRMDRFAQLALASSIEAAEEAGLKEGSFEPTRAGVILGNGIGGLAELEDQHKRLLAKGPGRVSAFTIPKLMANAGSGHISIHLGLQVENWCLTMFACGIERICLWHLTLSVLNSHQECDVGSLVALDQGKLV